MRIDGEQLAGHIRTQLAERVRVGGTPPPGLAIIYAGTHSVSSRFIERKRYMGEQIGVYTTNVTLPQDVSQEEILTRVQALSGDDTYHGIIVQLPLPQHITTQDVLNMVPPAKDIDVLSDTSRAQFQAATSPILPPVVGAINVVLRAHGVSLSDKHVVVVGHGRLVGQPVATWLTQQGITPVIIEKETTDAVEHIRKADILITGIGKPGYITPDYIKDGTVILDAGTATQAGNLRGDVDPACEIKCSLFTPVPGGLGPLTVAMIFENLITLWERFR